MDYYSGCPDFGGCPSSDEMGKVMTFPNSQKKFYIINLSARKDGGSHWVLLFQNLYFDSFGCPPPMVVAPFASVWNDTQYQDFHSSACGFYCIYVADNLLAGRMPTHGLIPDVKETKTKSSEHVLRDYFDVQVGTGFFPSATRFTLRPRAASALLA